MLSFVLKDILLGALGAISKSFKDYFLLKFI